MHVKNSKKNIYFIFLNKIFKYITENPKISQFYCIHQGLQEKIAIKSKIFVVVLQFRTYSEKNYFKNSNSRSFKRKQRQWNAF